MLQKIYQKLVAMCANGDTDTQKLCEMADNTALTMDCLCNSACPVKGVLADTNDSVTITPEDGDAPLVVGQNIAMYDAAGDIVGGAVIDGAGVTNEDGTVTYPIKDSTVATADIASVTTVKPVLAQAATAVKNIAISKLALATPVKEEVPVRG